MVPDVGAVDVRSVPENRDLIGFLSAVSSISWGIACTETVFSFSKLEGFLVKTRWPEALAA